MTDEKVPGPYDDLDSLEMSARMWGDAFEAAGRAGTEPGGDTEDDGLLHETCANWLITLRSHVGNAAAASGASVLLAWLTARYRFGEATAAADEDTVDPDSGLDPVTLAKGQLISAEGGMVAVLRGTRAASTRRAG